MKLLKRLLCLFGIHEWEGCLYPATELGEAWRDGWTGHRFCAVCERVQKLTPAEEWNRGGVPLWRDVKPETVKW